MFKGIIPVGAVDASSEGSSKRIASEYGVSGFPTMKLFGLDKTNPTDVQSRDPQELINTLLMEIQSTLQARGGADGRSSSSSGGSSSGGSKKFSSNVVKLTASNFQEKVLDNPEVSLVAFIAPWCGHCKALQPEWDEASSKLDGSGAFLGIVDATVETSLASQFGVSGYPTIKVFPGGSGKTYSDAMEYEGGRQSEQIVQYALAEVDRSGVPKEIPELTSAQVMKDTCEGTNKICVFFALPHILESGADGRNKYKDIMASSAKAVRGMSFHFIWFEGSSQPSLEQELELTFGYPAVAAYSVEKGVYAVHRASFTETNIRKFLMGITTGRQSTYAIRSVPEINTVEPWDGKDGVPFEEEPLDDIMGWDDEDEF